MRFRKDKVAGLSLIKITDKFTDISKIIRYIKGLNNYGHRLIIQTVFKC